MSELTDKAQHFAESATNELHLEQARVYALVSIARSLERIVEPPHIHEWQQLVEAVDGKFVSWVCVRCGASRSEPS